MVCCWQTKNQEGNAGTREERRNKRRTQEQEKNAGTREERRNKRRTGSPKGPKKPRTRLRRKARGRDTGRLHESGAAPKGMLAIPRSRLDSFQIGTERRRRWHRQWWNICRDL